MTDDFLVNQKFFESPPNGQSENKHSGFWKCTWMATWTCAYSLSSELQDGEMWSVYLPHHYVMFFKPSLIFLLINMKMNIFLPVIPPWLGKTSELRCMYIYNHYHSYRPSTMHVDWDNHGELLQQVHKHQVTSQTYHWKRDGQSPMTIMMTNRLARGFLTFCLSSPALSLTHLQR